MGSGTRQLLLMFLAMILLFNFVDMGVSARSDPPASVFLKSGYNNSDRDELAQEMRVSVVSESSQNDLNDFFGSFDRDKNGELDWNEAQSFYNWVRRNIVYRYDDESERNPIKGYLVGDGRPGIDHQQTPLETYKERAGDCEDQNGLIVAFFRYWGFESKLGIVKIRSNEYHAFAVVKMDDMSLLPNGINKVFYYDISNRNSYGLSAGKYIVVDSTYGKRIGELATDKILDTTLIQTR